MPSKHGKGWRARWIDQHGKRHSQTFTRQRDAEKFEHRKKAEAEEIACGLRAEKPVPRSFGELCDYWIANRASQKRSRIHDESIIRKHLRTVFGALHVTEVGAEAVDRFVGERAHLSPKTIANVLTLLIAMLNVAKDIGWLQAVPRIRKPRVRLCDEDFRYIRTDREIARILAAARDEGPIVHALYAMAIWTGLRKGELAALRWDDVDIDKRLVTVQRSFDGPTKAGDVRHVPIVDALLPVLRAWRLQCPNGLVFPNAVGALRDPASRIFSDTFHRVLLAAGLPPSERSGRIRPYVTFHGLRHTFASHWVMKGGDLFKLQKILGHKSAQMTMRYAHLAPDAFAEDWSRFGRCATESATIVPLSTATEPADVAGVERRKSS